MTGFFVKLMTMSQKVGRVKGTAAGGPDKIKIQSLFFNAAQYKSVKLMYGIMKKASLP